MKYTGSPLGGVYVVEVEPVEDDRGFFARTFCEDEFSRQGLETRFVQSSIAFTKRKGTLRGMHYQRDPYAEAKLIRCTRGAVYDAVIDLRPDSPTFRHWFGVELTAENRRMLYVPKGFAHGYQTLMDETEISYQMSAPYYPDAAAGVRWNDPAFGIRWPIDVTVIADRDRDYPDFSG
jgi:dTDP-4-dehydrorhamnose 3,5-epimerase